MHKELTVAGFLNEIKRERVSGREFLALIGHSQISNEDYTEIKENPALTYERLSEILINSPLTSEDYEQMLDTVRYRRAIREQQRQNEKKAAAAAKALKQQQEQEERIYSEVTDEITLGEDSEDTDTVESEYEDLWEEGGKQSAYAAQPMPEDKSLYFDEYGENEDFEENASRENSARRIICVTLGLVLAFLSFFIRYKTTGEWLLADGSYKPPETYEEAFALLAERTAIQTLPETRAAPEHIYRAEKFAEPKSLLTDFLSTSDYIFSAENDEINAVRISGGKISPSDSYRKEGLIGIFIADNKLYAVYTGEYGVSFTYAVNETEETLEFTQPCVSVLTFDAQSWNGAPISEYRQDGVFSDIIAVGGEYFLITDYAVNNTVSAENPDGYIPTALFSGERRYIPLENITFIEDSPYKAMTVAGILNTENIYAAAGGYTEGVYSGGGSLLLSFPNDGNTDFIKYNVYEKRLETPIVSKVNGDVPSGFADVRNAYIRIIAVGAGESILYVFDEGFARVSAVEKIAPGEIPKGAAFDDGNAYIIAENLYAIDTSSPEYPIPVSGLSTLVLDVTDLNYYGWGEDGYVTIGMEADEYGNRIGVRVTLYEYREHAPPEKKASKLLQPPNPDWNDYMSSPIENPGQAGAAAVSRESGIIVVPISYFDMVTRVERYIVLGYDGSGEFTEKGTVDEFVDAYSKNYAAAVSEGYIYCFFGDMIKSAATDTTIVGIYSKS